MRVSDRRVLFCLNTTVGVAGVFRCGDQKWGFSGATMKTLAKTTGVAWGVSSGAYVVLPLLGPSLPSVNGSARIPETSANYSYFRRQIDQCPRGGGGPN